MLLLVLNASPSLIILVLLRFILRRQNQRYAQQLSRSIYKHMPNKRLKRDCQRAAFPVPLSRGGFSCCV
ncbi:hypothetical protein FLM05_17690 [Vibrio cholerae]|nr:hypothetical protein [Vibrio cholerae]TQO83700.1 hypothetical protein FLM05_17690 [Vibrio cholerae]TQP78211.1 hypothetical protein FLL88_15115 [Vibrio cholerae]TXX75011.1 hypothetical protein FXE96_16265 [Vibrio cholerae]TYA65700.1 hypothetical protein FXE18_10290 [Vibrio cholerae]